MCFLLQELVSEFEPFKQKLDKLRTKGGDLIKHTPDSNEKHTIQKALADINRLWSSVQTKAGQKSRDLREANQLVREFAETCATLESWVSEAEDQLTIKTVIFDFAEVRDQLKKGKVRKNRKILEDSSEIIVLSNLM